MANKQGLSKDELRQIPYIDRRIRENKKAIKRLKEESIEVSSLEIQERVQKSTLNHSMENVDRYIDLERELATEIDELNEIKTEAHTMLKSIQDPREKELMILRYINGYTWEDIAYIMNLSYRHTLRIHSTVMDKYF